jgi:O-antigen ligase
MKSGLTIFLCLALLCAGVMGLTLSVPLQATALILLAISGLFGVMQLWRGQYDSRLLVPVVMTLGYLLIRAWFSPVWDLAIEDLYLIVSAGLFYLLSGHVSRSISTRLLVAAMVLLILVFHLGSAVLQSFGGEGYSMIKLLANGGRSEGNVITGMYGYRGSFANFAIISGMLALSLGLWGRLARSIRITLAILGFVALGFAVMAHSRSAMISLAAGGFVLIVMLWLSVKNHHPQLRSKIRFWLLSISCLGIITVVAGGVMVFQNRAQETAQGSEVMFDSGVRLAFWPMAIEQFIDHPLIGAGSRSYSYECFHYWSPNLDTGEANPEFVHNEYLQALADYGLIGFVLITGLLAVHLGIGVFRVNSFASRLSKDGIKEGSNAMALTMAGVVGIVAMSVHVIFDFRTHLLPNLLLLVCCLVWVLPITKKRVGKVGISSYLMIPVILALSGWALWTGVLQLKGGIPLMKNGMAGEHGTWEPEKVNASLWIPILEQSIQAAPTYRRHLKLGTLYRLKADEMSGSDREFYFREAIAQYEKAASRHQYEPVSRINLAGIHAYLSNYEKSDAYYAESDRLAASRERWFRIRTRWADLHRQWAGSLWSSGEIEAAESHYARALEILDGAMPNSEDTRNMYLMIIIDNVRMQDGAKNYQAADQMLDYAEEKLPLHVINSPRFNIRREMGDHYLRKGRFLWYNRKPEEAYKTLKKAEKSYQIHQVVLKGREDKKWEKSAGEVKEILKFFKATGVGGE